MDWRHPRSTEQVGSMMMLGCGRGGTVQPLQTPWGTILYWEEGWSQDHNTDIWDNRFFRIMINGQSLLKVDKISFV